MSLQYINHPEAVEKRGVSCQPTRLSEGSEHRCCWRSTADRRGIVDRSRCGANHAMQWQRQWSALHHKDP